MKRWIGVVMVIVGALSACSSPETSGSAVDPPGSETAATSSASSAGGATSTSSPAEAPPTGDPAADEAAALGAFERYRTALLAKDGAGATAELSSSTVAYYEKLRLAALDATAAELDRLPTIDVIAVLGMRQRYDAGDLAPLDGTGVLVLAIDDGLIGESSVARLRFDRATITGDRARLGTRTSGQALQGLILHREQGAWKVDLATLTAELGRTFDAQADAAGQTHTEAALALLRRSGGAADASLLQPLR